MKHKMEKDLCVENQKKFIEVKEQMKRMIDESQTREELWQKFKTIPEIKEGIAEWIKRLENYGYSL